MKEMTVKELKAALALLSTKYDELHAQFEDYKRRANKRLFELDALYDMASKERDELRAENEVPRTADEELCTECGERMSPDLFCGCPDGGHPPCIAPAREV
jgi:hypothetical protein